MNEQRVMRKALVAGATGQLGKCVLTELKQRGYAVRAIARDAGKLAGLGIDETVTADLTEPETLRGVADGVEFVISCAGATMNMNNFGDRKSFYEVDHQGNRNLLAEAKRAGVKKFVYVSLACADQLRRTEYADAHEKFVEDLRASGMPHTVVRPTGFFGFMLEILKFAGKGRGILIGDGACRTNPIHQADVAAACVEAVESNQPEMAVGGPDVLTRRQITEQAFDVLQRKPNVMSISPGVFKLIISPLRLVNRRIHALMDFGIAVTQIDVVAPAYGSRQLRTYFEDAVRGASAT
jgi:uncharacterized protein YbjT (DUF2867 family)